MTTIVTLHPVSGHEMSRRFVPDAFTNHELSRLRSFRQSGYAITKGRIVRVIRCVKGEIPAPTERYAKMIARDVMADYRTAVRL